MGRYLSGGHAVIGPYSICTLEEAWHGAVVFWAGVGLIRPIPTVVMFVALPPFWNALVSRRTLKLGAVT